VKGESILIKKVCDINWNIK